MLATGSSTWAGTWKEGSGALSTGSDVLKDMPYSFSSRFEGTPGASPEEFLAVAQAGCFNQALANNFGMIGFEAERIKTSVTVELGYGGDGHPAIKSSTVVTEAKALGMSQDPDFFLAHYDLKADPAIAEALPSPTGYAAWVDVLVRLTHVPAVTISAIRGICRGAGSEFVLSTDLRYASREKAILGQMEVGFTALPGGGAAGRLPAQVGRGRTFEILLGGEDYNAELAQAYGYVNRAIPDAEFDAFVAAYATRVSKWDRRVIGEIKHYVNKYTLLPDSEFPPQSDAFWGAAARPEFQSVTTQLIERGLQTRGELEYNLGAAMGTIFPAPQS